jgi:hypothetical protein
LLVAKVHISVAFAKFATVYFESEAVPFLFLHLEGGGERVREDGGGGKAVHDVTFCCRRQTAEEREAERQAERREADRQTFMMM